MRNNLECIFSFLDFLFPNPTCELYYSKDYELLIAVMLSAQTTDKRVNEVTKILFDKYKDIDALSNANVEDIKSIIRPIGTFNKKAIFIKKITEELVTNYNGIVPNNRNILEELPGVGRKTTNVVLNVLFNIPAIAVDTHVSRVSKRLGLVNNNDDVSIIEKKLMKKIDKNRWNKTHHQFVLFGRYYCKSKNPKCGQCKLREICNKER